jgi:cardiolipin synthase
MTQSKIETKGLVLLCGGTAFFHSLLQAVDAAQHEIYFETYLFEPYGAVMDVVHAFARAAKRGVRVRLVFDGVGTKAISQQWQNIWDEAGVQWRIFEPVGTGGLWFPSRWRRLHRKLCVVDSRIAFCGGINLLDDYYDPHSKSHMNQPRLDFAVRLEKNQLVEDVMNTVHQFWGRLEASREFRRNRVSAARGQLNLVLRDNLLHRYDIQRHYLRAIGHAHQEIIIANAFFFPGRKIRRALLLAAQRGIKVRLLLQGHFEYQIPYRAAKVVYSQLLQGGIEIFEYQASYLHAKVAVIDGRWATVGSSNLDPLSLLLAREANVVAIDQEFAETLRQKLNQAIKDGAQPVSLENHSRRGLIDRFFDRCAFLIMNLAIFLTAKRY